jgi:hypothetical protein
MGVITTAYAIPAPLMRKIRADHDNLAFVLDNGDEEHPKWKVEQFDFDGRIDETHSILRACGYRKAAESLDLENYFYPKGRNYLDYEGYNVWILTPAEIKKVAAELENATFEELKAKGLANEATDYDGKIIDEFDYHYYVGDIAEIKKFFETNAGQGNYLLFAVA